MQLHASQLMLALLLVYGLPCRVVDMKQGLYRLIEHISMQILFIPRWSIYNLWHASVCT